MKFTFMLQIKENDIEINDKEILDLLSYYQITRDAVETK